MACYLYRRPVDVRDVRREALAPARVGVHSPRVRRAAWREASPGPRRWRRRRRASIHSRRGRSTAGEAATAPGDHLPWPAAQLLLPASPEVDVVAAAWRLEHGGLKPSHSGEVAPPRGEVASPREGGRPGGGRCSTPACRTAGSSRGRPCTSPPWRVAPRARAPAAAQARYRPLAGEAQVAAVSDLLARPRSADRPRAVAVAPNL